MSGIRVWSIIREKDETDRDCVCQEKQIRDFCAEQGYEIFGQSILRGGRASKVYAIKKIAKEHNVSIFVTTAIDQISDNEEEAALIFQELLEDYIVFCFSDIPHMRSSTIVSIYQTHQELKEHGLKFDRRKPKRKSTSPSAT